jgi:hypothetical protein
MAFQNSSGGIYNPNQPNYSPVANVKANANFGSPANTMPQQQQQVQQQTTALNAIPTPATYSMAPPSGTSGMSAFAPPPRQSVNQVMNQPQNFGGQAGSTGSTAPGEGYGPGFGEQYGQSHVGQYDTPTMLEQFAQSQMNGNNPYYDRLRQQGMDQINQQMAARGHYNSGGAMSALGNFAGQLGASQFADMGNLLGNASNTGLNRMGQGNQMAVGVQQQQQNRMQNQFGNLSDLAHLGAGLEGGFYGQGGQQSGDAAMAGINAGANASQLTGQGQSALPNMAMQGLNTYFGAKKYGQ